VSPGSAKSTTRETQHSACGCCEHCFTGWETICKDLKATGFAEYVLAEAAYVGRIPDGLDYVDAAPILCAGVTTYKGLKETDTKPGDWMVISGICALGHLAVQYAKAMGLHVVALARGDEKLELAKQLRVSARKKPNLNVLFC